MESRRRDRVEDLYNSAATRSGADRDQFLERECGDDRELRREIDARLRNAVPGKAVFTRSEHLPLGSTVGQYLIKDRLGCGGMGVVYRAWDTTLRRDVALKVIAEDCASDARNVARFQREARALAALNHPNVATIHGFEQHEGVCFLVLELVPGATLEEKLRSGPLPPAEAVETCRQVAAGIEAAHDRGILHRDLKPGNIKITPENTVKVLDFGLAKNIERAASASAPDATTATADCTQTGTIVGTAPYMSPEQIRGGPVDKRTDIWSFGCVLYEALTGRRAFRGATGFDHMAAILEREPDWNLLPADTPPNVRRVLSRCLQKNPHDRLRDIGDAKLELDAPEQPVAMPVKRRARAATLITALLLIAAAATAALTTFRWRTPVRPRVARFVLNLAGDDRISASKSTMVAFSPDGTRFAYTATQRLAAGWAKYVVYVRSLDEPAQKALEMNGAVLTFSPNGKWIAYFEAATRSLKKVALSGGAPVRISAAEMISGATWGPDDHLIFSWINLYRVSASGGNPELLLRPDESAGERFLCHPWFLPDGHTILYTAAMADTDSYDDARIMAFSPTTKTRTLLIEGGTSPRYSPSGHLVYARGGKLLAVSFDAKRLKITGQPYVIADGVFMSANSGMASYTISPQGDLIYTSGGVEGAQRMPVWVDRRGVPTPLPLPQRSWLHPRLSPNERELAIEIEGPAHDLYTYDFGRGTLTRASFDGASHWPMWTPRGDRITYRSWKTGTMTMWWMNADRSGPPQLLADLGRGLSPESWSPDGRWLAYTQIDNPGNFMDVRVVDIAGDRRPRTIEGPGTSSEANTGPAPGRRGIQGSPKFSPDGKWLAYCSNVSGRPEVYVTAHPGPGPIIQVSNEGGTDPVWRRKGGEVYYRNSDEMMAVSVSGSDKLTFGRPRRLWEGRYMAGLASSCGMPGPASANYDVSADGERFLMIRAEKQDTFGTKLNIVLNWSAELVRRDQTRQ